MAMTCRNAPLTAAQKRALKAILRAHRNPGKKRRKASTRRRATSKRKLTKAQRRAISLRNLRKARAALGRRGRMSRRVRRVGAPRKRRLSHKARLAALRNLRKARLARRWKGLRTVGDRARSSSGRFSAGGPSSYGGYSTEGSMYEGMMGNPRTISRRGGKRYVTITRKDGKGIRTVRKGKVVRIKALRFRIKSRKGKVPARLRKYQFKAGTPRLAKMLRKARAGYKAWRRRQIARR